MKTIQLWLEEDTEISRFSRLQWRFVDVSFRDVVVSGIHPWLGPAVHLSVVPGFIGKLNAMSAKITRLEQMKYSVDLLAPPMYSPESLSFLERMLRAVRDDVMFVDDLSYLELMELAKTRLKASWNHSTAEALARAAFFHFQDLRRFLKEHNKKLKLSGYEDLGKYDLGSVLSLEDFAEHDQLVLSHGIPTLNFRRVGFLKNVTDAGGRLRLVPEISSFTLSELSENGRVQELDWRCTHAEGKIQMHPDVGGSLDKRDRACRFAKRWRLDEGRLCFQTSLERVASLVEDGQLAPAFPGLDYVHEHSQPAASAVLRRSGVDGYVVGPAVPGPSTVENLRELLRSFGEPMTGTKSQLLKKVAQLAVTKYRQCEDELANHFRDTRYVRAAKQVARPRFFPVLEREKELKSFLLALYMLRHLRGDSVLDPDHVNDTFSIAELALALAEKRTEMTGMFLAVS